MKIHWWSPFPLLVSFVLIWSPSESRGDIQIDNFLSGTGSNDLLNADPGATVSKQYTGLTGTFGTTRDVTFQNFSSSQSASLFFLNSPNPIDGHLVGAGINNGSQLFNDEWSRATFIFDSNGGGLNLDLSLEETLILEWQPDHLANARNTVVSISLVDGIGGNHTETVTFSTPLVNPGFLETGFTLSNFASNGVDLTSIYSATLTVDTDVAGDYTFAEFRAVPEPSSAIFLTVAGVVFLLIRPQRRRYQA
jgi:hypothetical protein